MLLDDGDIGLEANQIPLLQPQNVVDAWGCIVQNSVESLAADLPDVFSFADTHCLYFFTIRHVFEVGEEGEIKNNVLSSTESIEWDVGRSTETIGLVYLASSHIPNSLNIGISLLPEARTQGFARRAIWLVLNWAFMELQCHRIQAQVIDGDPQQRDTSLGLFTGLGFSHEGILRRAVFYPTQPIQEFPLSVSGEWRDLINLSILDMDWVLRSATPRIPRQLVKSRWDELFARHEVERDAMLRLEEWEEERRTAAAQLAAAAVPADTPSDHTDSLRKNKTPWQTTSKALAAPAPSFLDDHSQQLPQQPLPISDSSDEAVTDKKARKRAKRSRARAKKFTATVDSDAPLLSPVPHPAAGSETITFGTIDGMPMSSNDERASTPTPMRNAPFPMRPRASSFSRIGQLDGDNDGALSSGDEEWETASNSTVSTESSSNAYSASDIGSFSDVESVPRSPSVASIGSHSSVSTADSWDLLETNPNGSHDPAGASDMEE